MITPLEVSTVIGIIAKGTFKSECVETFLRLAQEMVLKTRQEPGCTSYQLCQDVSNSNAFAFVETWLDLAAIEEHNHSPHFISIVPLFADLLTEPMKVELYNIID